MSLHDMREVSPPGGTATAATLDVLDASEFPFHLTGSRFAGTATDASDWDFLAPHSITLSTWMLGAGFKQLSAPDEMYQGEDEAHPYTFCVWARGTVQVQAVEGIEHARRTRDLVYSHFREADEALRLNDKARRGDMWVCAARLVGFALHPRAALVPDSGDPLDVQHSLDVDDFPF